MPKMSVPANLVYRAIPLPMASELITTQHYSHRLPSSVQLVYSDFDNNSRKPHAVCVFSNPTGRSDIPAWELTRLVRLPNYKKPLTQLIGKALGHIRSNKLAELLLSFADVEEDHHGGIYQACSWVYDGSRQSRLDGFNVNGEFVPARTCNSVYGTSSVEGLQEKLGDGVEPHFDCEKHLYWKALTKVGIQLAVSYNLESRPYPKPMLNGHATNNHLGQRPSHARKGVVELPSLEIVIPKAKPLVGGVSLVQRKTLPPMR